MRTHGKFTNPTIRVVRTRNHEGVESSQKVIVAKVSLPYSEELHVMMGARAEEPMALDIEPAQRTLEEVGLAVPARGRPRLDDNESADEETDTGKTKKKARAVPARAN